MKIPMIIAIPLIGVRTNVSGRHRHTAIAVFSPGRAPKTIPKRTPPPMSKILTGLRRDIKPVMKFDISLYLPISEFSKECICIYPWAASGRISA